MNQWTQPSEYDTLIIEWHAAFDAPARDNPWVEMFPGWYTDVTQANVDGWSLDWEVV